LQEAKIVRCLHPSIAPAIRRAWGKITGHIVFFSHSQAVQDKSTGGDKCPDLRCRIAAISNITLVLESVGRGDAKATEELFPLVYEELRRLAAARMAKEAAGHMLQPTALVHEAWLQLVGAGDRTWKNRAHFLARRTRCQFLSA
jgi:hypothetical protein